MTNRQLVKRYKNLQERASKLNDWFCSNGMGHLRLSDMRDMDSPCSNISKYLKIVDELEELTDKAKRRYGPDLKFVEHLI